MEQVTNVSRTSMFKEARAIADSCKDAPLRDLLRARVDLCRAEFDLFVVNPSQTNMECLVASWTRMLLAVNAVAPMGGEPTNAGRVRAPAPVPELDLSRFTA